MSTGISYESLDERLVRLEVAQDQQQRTLARVVALMDGDPSYHIVGMHDQLAAYIRANAEWQTATEKRILSNETRLDALENSGNIIVLTRSAMAALVIIGVLCLVGAFMLLTWLQRAG